MTPIEKLLDKIYKKCISGDAGCMDWNGAVQSQCKSPSIRRAGGGNSMSLRRYMWEIANGKKPPASKMVTYTCGNSRCVLFEHMGLVTRAYVQQRTYEQTNAFQRLMKAKRVSAKARTRAKLTPEIVQAIKNSDEPQRVVAKRYGVVQSTISQIKRGVTWQDYDNPFTRLAA